MATSAEFFPVPAGRHEVDLGPSLSRALKARKGAPATSKHDREFYSVRYASDNFRPESIDTEKPGSIEVVEDRGKVDVRMSRPTTKGDDEPARFIGQATSASEYECVLIYDEDTGRCTLEKLDTMFTMVHDHPPARAPRKAASPAPPRPAVSSRNVSAQKQEEEESEGEIPEHKVSKPPLKTMFMPKKPKVPPKAQPPPATAKPTPTPTPAPSKPALPIKSVVSSKASPVPSTSKSAPTKPVPRPRAKASAPAPAPTPTPPAPAPASTPIPSLPSKPAASTSKAANKREAPPEEPDVRRAPIKKAKVQKKERPPSPPPKPAKIYLPGASDFISLPGATPAPAPAPAPSTSALSFPAPISAAPPVPPPVEAPPVIAADDSDDADEWDEVEPAEPRPSMVMEEIDDYPLPPMPEPEPEDPYAAFPAPEEELLEDLGDDWLAAAVGDEDSDQEPEPIVPADPDAGPLSMRALLGDGRLSSDEDEDESSTSDDSDDD
ncbi:RNA polymerase II transcription elongation factor-domain-containing protein [Epithele typhae]|uniref:RNA polymerase II transcription elongation factor-domain-containing protein n=1 Tax=Epithele typhae TaxID=378194 RepID=UPI0020081C18|nr:RNA polymerase II transcription elongation factor-domain-containing protein [Epithele typhae]KAH9921489.1 RNA polymerase II transcription elongation factor-domain-containing protein [Epithele typhae]